MNIRPLQQRDYLEVWREMQQFTDARNNTTPDEIWLIEHPPVYTLGQNGKAEHILDPRDIPVISVDRGGQVTYHGPGQLVVYVLLDLRRLGMGVRQLVTCLETAVIDYLAELGIAAYADPKAPGIYVQGAKIASLGLRVRRGCSYHGLSFNIDMDLEPFSRINPCGFQNLPITQLRDFGVTRDLNTVAERVVEKFLKIPVFPASKCT